VIAVLIVVGSYMTAEYLRVWRPRRRGLQAASLAHEPPSAAAQMAEICHTAEVIAESEAVADAQMSAALVEAAQHPAATPRTSLVDPTPAPADS
jgi:hypothetical protein